VSALRPVGVGDPRAHLARDPRHHEPEDDGAQRPDDELQEQERNARLGVLHGGQHRGLEDHQGGRVVEQPLALQHRQQAAGHLHRAGDRLHRDRVRRRDHGAERHRAGKSQTGDERRGGAGDGRHRQRDQRDGEEGDRAPPRPEERPRRALGRREQQRRQEQRKDQVGIEVERVGQARDEGHHDPEHHHQRRPRQPKPVAHADQHDGRQHQADDEQQDLHRDSLPGKRSVAGERVRVDRLRRGCGVRDDDVAGRDAAADQLVAPRAHLVVARVVAPRRPGGDDGPDGQRGCRHQRGDVPHTCHPVPLRRPARMRGPRTPSTLEVTGPGGRLRR
jgi:hypothetical protein